MTAKTTYFGQFPYLGDVVLSTLKGMQVLVIKEIVPTVHLIDLQRAVKNGDQLTITCVESVKLNMTDEKGRNIYRGLFGFEECCENCRQGKPHHSILSPQWFFMTCSPEAMAVNAATRKCSELISAIREISYYFGCQEKDLIRVHCLGYEYVIERTDPKYDYDYVTITSPPGQTLHESVDIATNPIIPPRWIGKIFDEIANMRDTIDKLEEVQENMADIMLRCTLLDGV